MRLNAPFLHSPPARRLIEAFERARAPVRFVGGCVRDGLLGRTGGDIDLCTPFTPDAVVVILEQAGIKVVPTGIAHGTVTAIVDHHPFEVTTLRQDVETDGRHAVVAFTDDWQADAARRDLTINALSADPDGTLHDYFGGIADLNAGHIRFVGDPATRLTEDVLRLLRFYRFFAWFGRPPFDAASRQACREHAPRLPRLSAERVATELLKLLTAPDPLPAWHALKDDGGLDHWLPEATETGRLEDLCQAGAPSDPLLRLAALLPDEAAARTVSRRLKFSNEMRHRLMALCRGEPPVDPAAPTDRLRDMLYELGHDLLAGRLWLASGRTTPTGALEWMGRAPRPVLPLAGRDILALGVAPGPEIARLLKTVEGWWRAGGFAADAAACRAYAAQLIETGQAG